MIDLKKINDLNKKGEFKKFTKKHKVDEPFYIGNYLFHYLIMYGNLNALKFAKHPIFKENDEGLAGVHLAAKIGQELNDFKVLDYLLKNYEEYIYNADNWTFNFLNYLSPSDKFLDLMKNNQQIDWMRLFLYSPQQDGVWPFLYKICSEGSSKLIKYVFKKYIMEKLDKYFESTKEMINNTIYFFTGLIENTKLKNSDLIKIYDKIDKEIIHDLTFNHNGLINFSIKYRNLEMVKYFVEVKGLELDRYDNLHTLHPFIHAYKMSKENFLNSHELVKYIWNKIKKNVNWDETDLNGENLAFRLLDIKFEYQETNKSPSKLELDVLKSNTVWNRPNVEKFTILSMLINFHFYKYHKILKNKTIDLEFKNGSNQNIIEESDEVGELGWFEYFFKLKNKKSNNKVLDETKLKNYKYSDSTIFEANFLSIQLSLIYLQDKIKSLYLPKNIKSANFAIPSFSTLLTFPFGREIEIYNNFPYFIIWKNENKYFIHPMLNLLIKNAYKEGKYKFATVFVSVDLTDSQLGSLHANILIYNFETKTIEYFEPNGNSGPDRIHKVLREELCKDTGFKYLEPSDYMPVASFQYLAFENNEYELKPGDFGGFCAAWCFWYLEHRILNPLVDPKELVQKLTEKILRSKYNLVEYIRNYADNLQRSQDQIFRKIGIKKERITNTNKKSREVELIFNYIIKKSTISYK